MAKSSNMLPSSAGVTVEKLDKIYFCAECKIIFLFKLDVSEHQQTSSHTQLLELSLEG
jgi:hypothetical protein